jgi:FixJ family two-component response regulator
MDERTVIIADKDAGYKTELAEHFRKAGYQVEIAGSVARLVSSTLRNHAPVLLLGNDFDRKVSSPDLVHLLKKCNSRLQVIMVCDRMPLALARQLRQEGLFYHALQPTTKGDTEELVSAVACAFETALSRSPLHQQQAARSSRILSQNVQPVPTANRLKAFCWMGGLFSVILGIFYLAASRLYEENFTIMWLFFGFCALIIATQLLPIFRIKLPASMRAKLQAKRQGASPHGK